MKKILAAVAAVFVLAGCSNSTDTAAPETHRVNPDSVFVTVVRDNIPVLESVSDQTLIDGAKDACDAFEENGVSNMTVMAYAQGFVEGGDGLFTYRDAGAFIGAATTAYCPDISDQISELDLTGQGA